MDSGLKSWDFFYELKMNQGYQVDHLLSLRLLKTFCDNVLLEHGGLPHVLPLAVHLEQVEGVILSNFYLLSFLVRGLLHT